MEEQEQKSEPAKAEQTSPLAPTREQDEQPSTFSKITRVLAIPLSLGAGGYYGHAFVRDKSYDKLKNADLFKDAIAEKKANSERVLSGKPGDPNRILKPGEIIDTPTELKIVGRQYSKEVEEVMKKRGFDTMFKRYKYLHSTQRFESALHFATAAGVALGVMLTIADHKNLMKGWFGDKKEKDTPDQNISR